MQGMLDQVKEPLFKQLISGIEAEIPEEIQRDYHAIVVAGMKVLFDDSTHSMMTQRLAEAKSSGNMIEGIVKGTIDLIKLLVHSTDGQAGNVAAFPAAATLMYQIFDFAESQEPGTQYPNDDVAEATRLLMKGLAEAFGLTDEQLQGGVNEMRSANAPEGEEGPPEDMASDELSPEGGIPPSQEQAVMAPDAAGGM